MSSPQFWNLCRSDAFRGKAVLCHLSIRLHIKSRHGPWGRDSCSRIALSSTVQYTTATCFILLFESLPFLYATDCFR